MLAAILEDGGLIRQDLVSKHRHLVETSAVNVAAVDIEDDRTDQVISSEITLVIVAEDAAKDAGNQTASADGCDDREDKGCYYETGRDSESHFYRSGTEVKW